MDCMPLDFALRVIPLNLEKAVSHGGYGDHGAKAGRYGSKERHLLGAHAFCPFAPFLRVLRGVNEISRLKAQGCLTVFSVVSA